MRSATARGRRSTETERPPTNTLPRGKSPIRQSLILAVVVLFALTGQGFAQKVQDQSFDPDTHVGPGISAGVSFRAHQAQTFTVGISGALDCVDIFISRGVNDTVDLVCEIQTTNGGLPSGVSLATVTLPAASIPTNVNGVATVDLSPFAIPVQNGDVLALVMRRGVDDNVGNTWRGDVSSPYVGGAGYFRIPSAGTNWTPHGQDPDLGFRSYVTPLREEFIRGDVNGGGVVDISDAVTILNCLFTNPNVCSSCDDASDADDSGTINITDPVYLLRYLFLGGPQIPPPFPTCGPDPTLDNLGCASLPPCGPALSPPIGDYGDAPDGQPTGYQTGSGIGAQGQFPSLYNSAHTRVSGRHGITHTNADPDLRLGDAITLEADALTPDLDSDDGGPLLAVFNGIQGELQVDVSAKPGNPAQIVRGFINVLLDLNQDGEWRDHFDQGSFVSEWVVRNSPVAIQRGQDLRIATPAFPFGPSSARAEMWARVSVTPTPIDPTVFQSTGGWDGSGPDGGFPDGETEDVFFPCEGRLRVTYPNTTDAWGNRLRAAGDVVNVPGAITVENLALQPVVYVFRAKAEVAFQNPNGAGWFFGRTTNEYSLRLTPVGVVPAPGFPRVAPNPVNLPPKRLVTVSLDAAGNAGDSVVFNLRAEVDRFAAAGNNAVVDDTTHPTGHWDNIIGRLHFYPTAPCIIEYQQVGRHPIYMDWP